MASANSERVFNVLFLCTHNSARSVLAEAIMNALGGKRFRGYSAGSQPKGQVNPNAIATLQRHGHEVGGARSKSWDEFAEAGAPHMDFIFTVCDDAANETCPVWPGHPGTAHWGVADPSRASGSAAEIAASWEQAYRILHHRISRFVDLPFDALDPGELKRALQRIGQAATNDEVQER